MGIASDISALKTLSDDVVANKVSRFAYKERAYTNNDADGTDAYNVNQDNNIPVGTAGVMKVNQTVIELGWRARASSITRMLMNHFLGRVSYNLNKVNDWFNELLADLYASLGTADGIAILDSNAKINPAQLPKSDVALNDTNTLFTAKGAFTYTLSSDTARSWLTKAFGNQLGRLWEKANSNTGVVHDVEWANGLLVGATDEGLLWSEDMGRTWTQGTGNPVDRTAYTVVHENNIWLGGFQNGGAFWSEDGKTWTRCTGIGNTDTAFNRRYKICYNGTVWVASVSGNLTTSGIYISSDGKDWSQISSFFPSSIIYVNGIFVAGKDTAIQWSNDGTTWVAGTGSAEGDVYYANGIFVSYKSTIGSEGFNWSTDGKVWTAGTSATDSGGLFGYFHYANGTFQAGVARGVYWSVDGKNWVKGEGIEQDTTTAWPAVDDLDFANGLWLAGVNTSANKGLYYSTDGCKWLRLAPNRDYGIRFLRYVHGTWFMSDYSGIYYSDIDLLISKGFFRY